MEEVIKLVSQKTGLPEAQAKQAVETVLDVLKNRLPAPVAAQVEAVLSGSGGDTAGDALKGLSGLLGKE